MGGTVMDKNNGKVKLNDELLDRVSGGAQDPGKTIEYYDCPICDYRLYIGHTCFSGITRWTCEHCEGVFTIYF